MSKKHWLLFICLIAVLITGCFGKTSEKEINTESDVSLAGGEEHEPITIVTAQTDYSYFIEALQKVYPEIRIEVSSYKGGNASGYLKQLLEQGDIPDVYATNYMQEEELQKEYLMDLSQYDFVNSYSDTMLNQVDVEGAIYLLPSRYTVAGINYNKTMFEDHGWSVPQTFEELEELVAQIRKEAPEITPIMARMSLKGYPFQYFFALGNTDFFGTPAGTQWKSDFLNGKATAVGNLESTVEYYQKWIDAGYITDYDVDASDFMADFYDGRIAMVLGTATSRWTGVGKTTGETIEVGIMAWPGENGNHGMLLSNVARYYGLSKTLLEPGNEQKLDDALKIMEFMSTDEGQTALASGSCNGEAFPFRNFKIEEDSPLYEVREYIEEGYTAPLVYEKWEDHLLVPMADELIELVRGNITGEQLLEHFDELYKRFEENPDADAIGYADEDLTKEETARLSAMAMIQCAQADVSLVSLGGIYMNTYENAYGAQCGIYAGAVNEEVLNIFRPWGSKLAEIDLTGAEIKALAEAGHEFRSDPEAIDSEHPDAEGIVEYSMPYVLVVKNDEQLQDENVYSVVFNYGDYSEDIAKEWGERLKIIEDKNTATAIGEWIAALPDGHFSKKNLEY